MLLHRHKGAYWPLFLILFFLLRGSWCNVALLEPVSQDLGFDAKQIGWLIAVMSCTRIVAPNIWVGRQPSLLINGFTSFVLVPV